MNQEIRTALLDFRAENVASFEGEFQLSFRASTISDKRVRRNLVSKKTLNQPGVLPVLAIFGANASGKTNVFKAMHQMREMVVNSFRAEPQSNIPRRPFKGPGSEKPSKFEIEVVIDGVWYLYGYEISDKQVLKEWAYHAPNGISVLLFDRTTQVVKTQNKNKREWAAAKQAMRENALLLSACAQVGHPNTRSLYLWFRNNLKFFEISPASPANQISLAWFQSPETTELANELLRAADLGITNFNVVPLNPDVRVQVQKIFEGLIQSGAIPRPIANEGMPEMTEVSDRVNFVHRIHEKEIEFDESDESRGTFVWFAKIGWILSSLQNGEVLVIDEMDASLHPILLQEIIRLFQSIETNPNFGQLIFNSHSLAVITNAIGERVLGRDQILITEKDNSGNSMIFPLSDLAKRNDESIPKRYMAGFYGGIPILDFNRFAAALESKVKK